MGTVNGGPVRRASPATSHQWNGLISWVQPPPCAYSARRRDAGPVGATSYTCQPPCIRAVTRTPRRSGGGANAPGRTTRRCAPPIVRAGDANSACPPTRAITGGTRRDSRLRRVRVPVMSASDQLAGLYHLETRWSASTRRMVPEWERSTMLEVRIMPRCRVTPATSAPSVTPVATK